MQNKPRDSQFDTKLLIFRSRQVALAIIMVITIIVFTAFIFKGTNQDLPWYIIGTPLSLLGLAFILFPGTEQWDYRPWQSKPQKVEQQNFGR